MSKEVNPLMKQGSRVYWLNIVGIWKYIVAILSLSLLQVAQADIESGKKAYRDQDYDVAFKEFMPLAEEGNMTAEYYVGLMYANGYGLPRDPTEAKRWFDKFSKQFGVDAEFNLGVMYHQGKGVPQDYKIAINWFKKAAEDGDPEAQFNLGFFYDNDDYGVSEDRKEAIKWYLKAANQGILKAQNRLGEIYSEGDGIAKNYVQAYLWFNLAAERGDKGAAHTRDILAENMDKSQVAEAIRLTHEWHPLGVGMRAGWNKGNNSNK
ncbi:Sel1 domain-containing protein repeat-containing protein [Candidatus Nitrosoglobus terrae]|uniref:Sel1 domain-containing protein repeat-containing protein n=1 Tax=Candidatus Nitrosoglobus terrae TaxID=1630141 RepID=A0A1Q2SN44_9GAMM|nr:tetratricopeptide repeat protein [Candidatus Nitrosoglobus terrae]BAW80556.1 Sel1 domain-containing protein repeat-containing protein [Candidatus Nitrosoglobus terrae]